MKTPPPMPREQLQLMAVLIMLATLAVLLWLIDPHRRPYGKSRVDWPPATSAKP